MEDGGDRTTMPRVFRFGGSFKGSYVSLAYQNVLRKYVKILGKEMWNNGSIHIKCPCLHSEFCEWCGFDTE